MHVSDNERNGKETSLPGVRGVSKKRTATAQKQTGKEASSSGVKGASLPSTSRVSKVALQNAISYMQNHNGTQKEASEKFNVPKSTLSA